MLQLCCSRPPIPACVRAFPLLSAGEGSYVTLVPGFKAFSDAARGPLSLMRNEDAYGLVLMESGQRYRVSRCCCCWWCPCCVLT
jgi:hypothetical protein